MHEGMPQDGHDIELTFLGTGTSTGVPLIHCDCVVCKSKNPKNSRLRASALLKTRGKTILIDPSIDLRQQALRAKIPRIDAVLITHPHADHVGGVDDLRSFNFIQRESIPVFANAWTAEELNYRFRYIFKPDAPIEGGGVAKLDLIHLPDENTSVDVLGVPVELLPVSHGSKSVLGFKVGPAVYLTDCNVIPFETLERMKGLEVLILDCLRIKPHSTHLNLDQALEIVSTVRPKRTYLTHLGHDFEFTKTSRTLPKGVFLAYDGLRVKTRF